MSTATTAGPSATALNLQQAFRLALSVTLLYWLALELNWDMPSYGALAIVLISLDTTGASIQKGLFRVVGSTVGLAVGMLGLALFEQDTWLNLIYHTGYLVFVGYFMQTSRYSYAWFCAGYLPSLIWATAHGRVDYAFHYAVFRYLETTVGVVIFTVVCMLFWPRSAGAVLDRQGRDLWQELGALFHSYRGQLEGGQPDPEAAAARGKLAGTLSRMTATLQAAYTDTPSIATRKRAWEVLRLNARAVADAMELWHQSIADCRRLDLARLLPQADSSVRTVGRRLERIEQLWQARSTDLQLPDTPEADAALLAASQLAVSHEDGAGLPHLDRAALLSFVQQFDILELTSRELLRTMRILVDLEPIRDLESRALPTDLYRPASWDPVRLLQALVPATCFVVGYFLWLTFHPPTGPSVPNVSAAIALSFVASPINAVALIPALLLPLVFLVAPFYLFVMPKLDSGLQLLTLVFGYVFAVSSLLVGRLAPLRSATLAVFVMLVGISNQQVYSFVAVLDTGIMLLLGVGIYAVVQMLMLPMRPEQALLEDVRRFFLGCDRVAGGFDSNASLAPIHRRRDYVSMIRPALSRLQATQARLDFGKHPDNPPEKIQGLIDGMQAIAGRLQSLEIAYQRFKRHGTELPAPSLAAIGEVQDFLRSVFQHWARFESGDQFDRRRDELQQLSRDLQQQFEAVQTSRVENAADDRLLTDLYALMGCIQGLFEAMRGTQPTVNAIDWQQWAAVRF